jgi:hypothetical protein
MIKSFWPLFSYLSKKKNHIRVYLLLLVMKAFNEELKIQCLTLNIKNEKKNNKNQKNLKN